MWAVIKLPFASGVDDKVKTSITDPSAGYLSDKIDLTKMVVSGDKITVKDYSIIGIIEKYDTGIPDINLFEPGAVISVNSRLLMNDGYGDWRLVGVGSHFYLSDILPDDHHSQSHDHSSASGSGAINTDQVFKAGDGGIINYLEIGVDGSLRLFGTGRYKDRISLSPYNMYAYASTYNGVVCASAGAAILDSKWYVKTFDDTIEESVIATFKLPDNYEADTDITVTLDLTSSATSGDAKFGVGMLSTRVGDSYVGTESYLTFTVTAPAVAYGKVTGSVTFTGAGMNPGDDVSIVIYRDASDVTDTLVGDVLLADLEVNYIANKLGGVL